MDALERLRPVSDAYGALPVDAAFTWPLVVDDMPVGEWYMVAFRSIRRPDVDEARLDAYDEWAHREAARAPGFAHYFKGPVGTDGACMSFCFWTSRAEARAAAGRPAHARAAAITHETYSTYSLEFHRVRRREGATSLEFELYDSAEPLRAIVRPEDIGLDIAPDGDGRAAHAREGAGHGIQLGPATA
jgi:hypothetical protein